MPGFLVGAVLGFGEVRGEDDYGLVVGGADGEDVPGVGGDDQGGEEVELVGAIDDVAGADGAGVGVAALIDGAFDPFVAIAPQGKLGRGGSGRDDRWRCRRGRFLPRAW